VTETVDRMRRAGTRLLFMVPALLALTGCGLLGSHESPTDLCTELVVKAFPDGNIAITHKAVTTESLSAQTVTIEGTRSDVVPTAGLTREVAASCKYDHDVLLDFHWTKGPLL
jgi:hypothetical protein